MKKLFTFLLLFFALFMLAGSEPLWKNLPNYVKIQLELWLNMARRLKRS